MKQIDLPLYKFYLIEGMTQEDLNELALERNNLSEEVYRLNNIINEFDKWLENEIKFQEIVENAHFLRKARIKLQELKGSESNE